MVLTEVQQELVDILQNEYLLHGLVPVQQHLREFVLIATQVITEKKNLLYGIGGSAIKDAIYRRCHKETHWHIIL